MRSMSSGMRFSFVGDVCLGGGVLESVRQHGPCFPFEAVADCLSDYDVRIGNMEFCVKEGVNISDRIAGKLSATKEDSFGIVGAGFDALCLANNHIMDYGETGLRSSIGFLDESGVDWFGAGNTLKEASRVCWLRKDGRNIALIGACDFSEDFAGKSSAGVAPMKKRILKARLREAKVSADLIIVSLHGDLEFVQYPAPWRVDLARFLIDEGANIVIQHHPHVWQGIETYRGGVIAYSLGNFVFRVQGNKYQGGREGVGKSFILGVDVVWKGDGRPLLSWHVLPVRIDDNHRPVIVTGTEGKKQVSELEKLSCALEDRERIRREWKRACRREIRRTLMTAYYRLARGRIGEALRECYCPLRNREDRRWLIGYISNGRL